MPKIRWSGPLRLRLASLMALNRIALATYARHALGRRMAPDWDASFEIGIRFWRHQFTRAMTGPDRARGRLLFDSLQTETDEVYPVAATEDRQITGRWYTPDRVESPATILYFHGGGYAFHGAMSRRYAAMLAHHCKARLLAPDYRLTPEHPHPAQAEDALAAWRHMTASTPADRIVVIGDSAGGHMALTLLQTLKAASLAQPALCIGLCPWTDTGERGASLHGNDATDLVQGWMALRFGDWLDPGGTYGRDALSPVAQDFAGLAPIYLQSGGREILRDMIRDFAEVQVGLGTEVMLDHWPDMPHDFQLYDSLKPASSEALARIARAVNAFAGGDAGLRAGPRTLIASGRFQGVSGTP